MADSRFRSLGLVILATLSSALFLACSEEAPSGPVADLVLRGGKVVTVDDTLPEAQAVAITGDRILAVGDDEEIAAMIGPETEVIELNGRLAIPGFIEGHAHFLGLGQARLQLDLNPLESWDAVVEAVRQAVAEAGPGAWIQGRGWHQEKWTEVPEPNFEGLPYHDALSAISPDNPVVLSHASGHATFANAKAMELGGVGPETADPPGGTIIRDGDGRAIGVFRETASGLIMRREGPSKAELRRWAEVATDECLAKGITSFQDAGSPFEWVDVLREMAEDGSLGIRLWMMIRDQPERLAELLPAYRVTDLGNKRLTVAGIKHSIDGALGSHGAWLLEPYTDLPETAGLNTVPVEVIEASAQLALQHGYQLCVHAIGDRANRETLDIFEQALAGRPGGKDLRWRIEHAQHIDPADLPRFAELGVIASMQGVHCTSDGPWVPTRLGDERTAQGAYLWRSLLDSGVVVSNGTDAPVENVDPIPSFYATVSRRLPDGTLFYPEEVLTRAEALRSYTLSAAYAAFEEDDKGSLTPGKLADVTVLSQDILTVPEEEILSTRVELTVLGGEVVYRRAE